MLISAIASIILNGVDADIIIRERPSPLSDGAAVFAICERVEVQIEYRNSWVKGVQVLKGRISFARKAKEIDGVLWDIRRQSARINNVAINCEAENTARIVIQSAGIDGGDLEWTLTVDERLQVRSEGSVASSAPNN